MGTASSGQSATALNATGPSTSSRTTAVSHRADEAAGEASAFAEVSTEGSGAARSAPGDSIMQLPLVRLCYPPSLEERDAKGAAGSHQASGVQRRSASPPSA